MFARRKPRTSPECEKLLYFITLRQIEAESKGLREAYQRLAKMASHADDRDLVLVILDWLEAEIRSLQGSREDISAPRIELMKAAVDLAFALKQ